MTGTARFSPCERYRYQLTRQWGDDEHRVVTFILLNPSTATAEQDDPTIRRCIGFAKAWGFDGLIIVNLFALRSTDPKLLRQVEDPVGPENDFEIIGSAHFADRYGAPVVCAWGVHGVLNGRAAEVRAMLREEVIEPVCLGTTKDGHPKHPLYLPSTLTPSPWT